MTIPRGPARAIAAGALTIYRNYFVFVSGRINQTVDRQLEGLATVGEAPSRRLGKPVATL